MSWDFWFPTTTLTRAAYLVACDAHFGQTDKAGTPYILHPIHLACQFQDETLAAAALLHDVLEDSNWTVGMLYGHDIRPDVVDLVVTLTRQTGERYFDYIDRVSRNASATKIKIADLKHNSDLSRLTYVTGYDLGRQKRYLKAIDILTSCEKGAL